MAFAKVVNILVVGVFMLSYAAAACPDRCVCSGDVVSCRQITKFPIPFETNKTRIEFYMSEIPDIPPRAFEGAQNATTIHFQQVKIGTIRGCAFEGVSSHASIHFDLTEIDTIEGNAFHDMHSDGKHDLYVSLSSIRIIKSFAFDSVQGFTSFEIHGSDIGTIENYAFHRFNNIGSMSMFDLNVTAMRSNAFEGFSNINQMDIFHASFGTLECNTLNNLRDDLGTNFSFYSLDVTCDCSIAWLHAASGSGNSGLVLDDVICSSPPNLKHSHLSNLTFSDICIGWAIPSCQTPSPANPEYCQKGSGQTTPSPSSAAIFFNTLQMVVICIVLVVMHLEFVM